MQLYNILRQQHQRRNLPHKVMIVLSKIPYQKATVLRDSLRHYIHSIRDKQLTEKDKINYSIAEEYMYKIASKFIKQQQPKTISFKFLYHQAKTMHEVLYNYQKEFYPGDLQRSILDQLKNELHKQLI